MQGYSKTAGISQGNSAHLNLSSYWHQRSGTSLAFSVSQSMLLVHLLFQIFHTNLKTAVSHSYLLETFLNSGENLFPEDLLGFLYT